MCAGLRVLLLSGSLVAVAVGGEDHACGLEAGADDTTSLLQVSKAVGQATARPPAGKGSTATQAGGSEAVPEGPSVDASAATRAGSSEAVPGGPSVDASAVLEHLNATQLEFLLDQAVRALVPKGLEPLSAEEIRALNASFSPGAALLDTARGGASDDIEPSHPGVFCGAAKRFDVAGFLGTSLSVAGCYAFSCISQFKVSSTCGPYFYTNGQGNCKCCDYGADYGYSSATPPNDLYKC